MSTTGTSAPAPRVAVFGSTNLDTSMRVHSLPRPGETVVALAVVTGIGGKGTNQAVAAVRSGVSVALLSAVGTDSASTVVLGELARLGVDASRVILDPDLTTGRAHVVVDDAGENSIVVASGANDAVSADYARRVADVITAARVLVVQGEVSEEATREAVRVARDGKTRVVANLAPFVDLGDLLTAADPVVVNGIEASQLIGRPIVDAASVRANAARFAGVCEAVVVTLGAAGAVLCRQGEVIEFPARAPGQVLDTTGAGDAFVGVLAAALATRIELEDACAAAVEAATRTVEAVGAAAAYPMFALPAVGEATVS